MEQVTRARTLSDAASVRVAHQYLQHEYLKGFPVPRMHIKDVEFELSFAVARTARPSILDDEELKKNILYRVRELVASLPDEQGFSKYFVGNPRLRAAWDTQLDTLDERAEPALARSKYDHEGLVQALCLVVKNYFYEMLLSQPADEWLPARPGSPDGGSGEDRYISDQIIAYLRSAVPPVGNGNTDGDGGNDGTDTLDMEVLVEAAELEKLNHSRLHKMKITFTSSDRKWLATEKSGQKTYILDRH